MVETDSKNKNKDGETKGGGVSKEEFILMAMGCKLPVSKVNDGDSSYQQAEILSVKMHPDGDLEKARFYIHYEGFNKRLDEWVGFSRLKINEAEFSKQAAKRARTTSAKNLELSKKKSKSSDSIKDDASSSTANLEPPEGFSREKEIEKLRYSGSMTQNPTEVARVRNISSIVMGNSEIETWYFSPYPEEYSLLDRIFICEFCLDPVGSEKSFERHRSKCGLYYPPGNEIYRNKDISFWEIDGRKQRRYCRNLCLLSKLFLDHKTLYYDVDPFLFYLMTRQDEYGHHLVGYFSKEKQSMDNYNVACILTLPQHQRMGYGKLLIEFSYELSKIEKKTGSPEKPLSDLGLLSYRSFWTDIILEKLIDFNGEISVNEISDITSFTTDDIMHTLVAMDVLKYYQGHLIICLSKNNIALHEKNVKKNRTRIDPSKIVWTPPKFTASQLRYGF